MHKKLKKKIRPRTAFEPTNIYIIEIEIERLWKKSTRNWFGYVDWVLERVMISYCTL